MVNVAVEIVVAVRKQLLPVSFYHYYYDPGYDVAIWLTKHASNPTLSALIMLRTPTCIAWSN